MSPRKSRLMAMLLGFLMVFVLSSQLQAKSKPEQKHSHPAPEINEDFKALYPLVGSWEGMNETEMGKQNVKIHYRLSSAKSVLVEEIFKGTPQEMTSMYHSDKDKIIMTHYCSLGNQPRMRLTKREGNQFHFKFKDGTNMKKKDPHMHALTITLVDKNNLRHEWVMSEHKKPKQKVVFNFKRTK